MFFMKKMIIGLCLISATTLTYATNTPERNVPVSVKEKFHKDYPDARAVQWKYAEGRWNANFHKGNGNTEMMSGYNAKGHHIDSRVPIAQTAIPDKVMNRLNEKYSGQYTQHYTKIERPMKRDLYKVRVKKQGVYRDLYLDKRGHEKDYASR
jgi:hypothetical protein